MIKLDIDPILYIYYRVDKICYVINLLKNLNYICLKPGPLLSRVNKVYHMKCIYGHEDTTTRKIIESRIRHVVDTL